MLERREGQGLICLELERAQKFLCNLGPNTASDVVPSNDFIIYRYIVPCCTNFFVSYDTSKHAVKAVYKSLLIKHF